MIQYDSLATIVIDSNTDTPADTSALEVDLVPTKEQVAEKEFRHDLAFAQYLMSYELYRDAQFLLDQLCSNQIVAKNQLDSALYYKAWLQYFSQDFDQALYTVQEIDSNSAIYVSSMFLSAMCFLEIKDYDESKLVYSKIPFGLNETQQAIKGLNLAGIALLERDYAKYDSIAATLPQNNFSIASSIESLAGYKIDMISYKRKSAFLAGLLSAIVPGLGKYYVGYRGTPFGALTLNLPLLAITIETLIISGWTGIPFLIAAPFFGVFYVGNIWGSALSAYAHEKEFYAEMDHNILYDLHIPVRRLLK